MSLLICTPCYGGQVHTAYLSSVMRLQESLLSGNVDHDFLFAWNESLITRGRDKMAATFLSGKHDRLMFIDSDIQFEPQDVAKLWNLDVDIAVGAYSRKGTGDKTCVWTGGKQVEMTGVEPFPVDYAGTGFMMIKRRVFEALQKSHPDWKYEENEVTWGFFQDPIRNGIHLSEDYFFCEESGNLGFKVLCDPTIRLKHWGQVGFPIS